MIVITTPRGLIGHQVLENLLDSGEALRVISRDPCGIPASARERVQVIEGSHGDPAVVDAAFAGADAVFWLAPPDPRAESVEAAYVGFTRPAAEAFKRAFSQECHRDLGSRPWHSLGSACRLRGRPDDASSRGTQPVRVQGLARRALAACRRGKGTIGSVPGREARPAPP